MADMNMGDAFRVIELLRDFDPKLTGLDASGKPTAASAIYDLQRKALTRAWESVLGFEKFKNAPLGQRQIDGPA